MRRTPRLAAQWLALSTAPIPAASASSDLPLRDACVEVARALIAEHGIENLSLRDVARRLGVSHQAPYKHYPSRDHLLAEVMRRCFQQFAAALAGRERHADPIQDMRSLGRAYLLYALQNPLEYRLMFGTPWPEAAIQEDLLRDARSSFNVLRDALGPVYGGALGQDQIDLNALFVWSSMHGLATILQSNVLRHLQLSEIVLTSVVEHAMDMADTALLATAPRPGRSQRRE